MTITQFGRVELDPNLVPAAAPGTGTDSARRPFDRELSVARRERQETERPPAEARREPTGEATPEVAPEVRDRGPDSTAADEPAAMDSDPAIVAPTANPTDTDSATSTSARNTGAEDTPRRIKQGKTGVPSASIFEPHGQTEGVAAPATTAATAMAAAAPTAARAATARTAASPAPTTATAPANAAQRAEYTAARVRSAPSYSGFDPRAVERLEAARDSIFRQIALRIGATSSEMRVVLTPPELGNLDVQVVVEKGGALRLSIVAERPEMVAMLDRHADELKQTLQARGFSDVQTHVQSGDTGRRQHAGTTHHHGAPGQDSEPDNPAADLRRAGFTVGEGIDFWA